MADSIGRFIGGIRFGVSMDTKRLKKDTKQGQKLLSKFTAASRTMLGGFSLSAAGATAALGVMVKQQFAAVDSLAKVSDKLGVATSRLAGLRLAANRTGIASQTLDMEMQRIVRRISEAAIGTGEAQDAIAELNLSAKELNALAPDKQFAAIADRMRLVDNQADRVRLAFKLFDSEGAALVNTLKLGSQGLEEFHKEAKNLGLAISREDAARIEMANDLMADMWDTLKGFARDIASKIAPAVIQLGLAAAAFRQPDATQRRRFSDKGTLSEIIRGQKLGGNVFGGDLGPRRTSAAPLHEQFRTAEGVREFIAKERIQKQFDFLSSLTKNLSGQAGNYAKGLAQGARGIANHPALGLYPALLRAMLPQAQAQKAQHATHQAQRFGGGGRGSLTFAETGSAESFRQRAAIRQERERGERLDRTRNNLLVDIRDKLADNGAQVVAANL